MTKPSALQVGGKKAKGRTNKATKTHKRKSMSKKMRHTKKHHKGGRSLTYQPYYDLAKSISMIRNKATIHGDDKDKDVVDYLYKNLTHKFKKSSLVDKAAPGFYISAKDTTGTAFVNELKKLGDGGYSFTFTTYKASRSIFGPQQKTKIDGCEEKLQENTLGEIKINYGGNTTLKNEKIKIQINTIKFKDDNAVPYIVQQSVHNGDLTQDAIEKKLKKEEIMLGYEYKINPLSGSNSIEFRIKKDAIAKAERDMLDYLTYKTSVIPNKDSAQSAFEELKKENKMVEDKEERYKSMYMQQINKYINKLKTTAYGGQNYQDYLVSYHNVSSIHKLESKLNEGSTLEKESPSIGEFSITPLMGLSKLGMASNNTYKIGVDAIIDHIDDYGCGMMKKKEKSPTSNDNAPIEIGAPTNVQRYNMFGTKK